MEQIQTQGGWRPPKVHPMVHPTVAVLVALCPCSHGPVSAGAAEGLGVQLPEHSHLQTGLGLLEPHMHIFLSPSFVLLGVCA